MMRVLAVVAALMIFAGAVALDAPAPGGAPATTAVFSSEPRVLPAVCPGPQTIPVGDIESGDTDLDSGSADVRLEALPAGGARVDDGTMIEGVGVSVERVGSGDLAGMAGMSCAPTSPDQWLVGGSTSLGSSARLVLSNPAASPVRAEIELFTPLGEVERSTSVVIGPQSQTTVALEAIQPEMPALGIRVTAGGLGVSAALQDSRLDGFTPAGSDWVTASALDDSLAVPVPLTWGIAGTASLTLLAPEGADVSLALIGDDEALPWMGESNVTLEPGVVTEVPLPSAEHGTVLIDASDPVTAAVRVSQARRAPAADQGTAYDFAWTGAQSRSDAREGAVVVPTGDVAIAVHADTAGVIEFEADGAPFTVEVPAGGSALVPLDLAPGTTVSSSDVAVWALGIRDLPGFVTTIEPVSTELSSVDTAVTVATYGVTGRE